MEFLFHLIFEFFKICLLSFIYAIFLLLIFKTLLKLISISLITKIIGNPKKFLLVSFLIMTGGLFIFSLTYWGNHGFGDHSVIPVGYSRTIENINASETFIPITDVIMIDSFFVTDKFVYGLMSKRNENYEGNYFVYNLDKNKIITMKRESDFRNTLIEMNLNPEPVYHNFNFYYKNYWNGWRFWFLP